MVFVWKLQMPRGYYYYLGVVVGLQGRSRFKSLKCNNPECEHLKKKFFFISVRVSCIAKFIASCYLYIMFIIIVMYTATMFIKIGITTDIDLSSLVRGHPRKGWKGIGTGSYMV